MAGSDAEPRHPMHVEAALRAVQRPCLELALEVGLHLEELEPEHLRMDGDRMIASTGSLRFVNEVIGLDALLGDGVDGVLEDVALAACHRGIVLSDVDAPGPLGRPTPVQTTTVPTKSPLTNCPAAEYTSVDPLKIAIE